MRETRPLIAQSSTGRCPQVMNVLVVIIAKESLTSAGVVVAVSIGELQLLWIARRMYTVLSEWYRLPPAKCRAGEAGGARHKAQVPTMLCQSALHHMLGLPRKQFPHRRISGRPAKRTAGKLKVMRSLEAAPYM